MYSKDMKSGEGLVIHLRPGFWEFLKEMIKLYEIVIFSNEDMGFLSEVIRTIDPYNTYFPMFFGHEFMLTKANGKYKDLNYINRNKKRLIVVDFDDKLYINNNYNVIKMDKYDGETED